MLERIFKKVIKLRAIILAVIALLTVYFSYHVFNLKIDPSLESWIMQDDPDLVYYREFKQIFGSDEILAVSYSVDNVFTFEELAFLKKITKDLGKIKDVEEVISLATALKIRTIDGILNISMLMEDPPNSEVDIARLKNEILSDEHYAGNLISQDGKTIAIVLWLADKNDNYMRQRIMDDIRTVLKAYSKTKEFRIAGMPALKVHITESAFRDFRIFIPLSIFVVILILYFILRTMRKVLIPLLVGFLGIIWTFGLLHISGRSASIITPIVIPMALIYGISTSLHVFAALRESGWQGGNQNVLVKSLAKVAVPCFMTSFTTVIGFASNGVSKVLPVREVGFSTAAAITLTYLFSFTLIPILLSTRLGAGNGSVPEKDGMNNPFVDRILLWIGRTTINHKKFIVLIFTLVSIVSVYGITRITVETDMLKFFKETHPLRQAYDFVEKRIGGYNPLEVVIEGEPDMLKSPDVLQKIDAFTREATKISMVARALSITDYLKAENQAIHENDPSAFKIPDSPGLISKYFFFLEGQNEIAQLITSDYSRTRVSLRLRAMSSTELINTIDKIKEILNANLPSGTTGRVTGNALLYANMANDVVMAQVESLLIAFFCIFIIMSINLRSIRIGLLSMIPNIFPILVNLGIMGIFGITLNIGTAMVSAIAIGIAVDDTTHFIYRIRMEVLKDGDYNKAGVRTITSVGKPMMFTTVVITIGYLIICLSSFIPNVHAGILTAIALVVALLADLFLTPVIFTSKSWGEIKPERQEKTPRIAP